MKLLLLYPPLADKNKRRVSREEAQLIGITHCIRALLKRAKPHKISVQQYAYNSDSGDNISQPSSVFRQLESGRCEFDLAIDISPVPLQTNTQNKLAVPVIHLCPTFSGSFACNDISIKGFGKLKQSDIERCISQNRNYSTDSLPSTYELNAEMHDSTFAPLPTRVGDAFYRTPNDHALVLLAYPEYCRTSKTIETDIKVLIRMLGSMKNVKSVTFVCERLEDVPLTQQVADRLTPAVNIKPSIWGLRKGEFHDLFSVMAKSNVVFFGGSALFIDAVINKVPVFPWRNNLPGAEHIAQAYQQFATHQKPDRKQLLQTQRKHLNRVIETQYLDSSVPNNHVCFNRVLTDLINHATRSNVIPHIKSESSKPNWVVPPAQQSKNRTMPDKLSRSIWSNRQKLLQFKQPTNRQILGGSGVGDLEVFTILAHNATDENM